MLLAWYFKIMAFNYDRVSRVSPIMYLETAIALFIDIVIFHVKFSVMQVIGLVIVIGVFLVIIVAAYLSEDEVVIIEPAKTNCNGEVS